MNNKLSLTSIIARSSILSINPLPSLSYTLKDHLSLCSRSPLKTRFSAATNSRKSIVLSYWEKIQQLVTVDQVDTTRMWKTNNSHPILVKSSKHIFSILWCLSGCIYPKKAFEFMKKQNPTWAFRHKLLVHILQSCNIYLLMLLCGLSLTHACRCPRCWKIAVTASILQ